MYSYKASADEQAEDKANEKKYKKYSYNEIKRIVEEKENNIVQPTLSNNKSIKNITKNINKKSKNDKPNHAQLFYNLFN